MRMFKKGQSGNPSGKPKLDLAFRDRCKKAVDKECVTRWLKEITEQGEHWVRCSELLAAYGYGKPKQIVTGPDGDAIKLDQAVTIYLPGNGR